MSDRQDSRRDRDSPNQQSRDQQRYPLDYPRNAGKGNRRGLTDRQEFIQHTLAACRMFFCGTLWGILATLIGFIWLIMADKVTLILHF